MQTNRKRTFIDCGKSEACVKTIPVLGQQAKRASTSVSDNKRFLMPQHSFTTALHAAATLAALEVPFRFRRPFRHRFIATPASLACKERYVPLSL